MEQLLQILSDIGLPADEVRRVRDCCRGDEPGLRDYVTLFRALFDDRHEYLD